MLDVALDPYNSDGHDGLVRGGVVQNDETLLALEKMALVQAEAGCDILGPSDMMDGRIGVIRHALELHHFPDTLIMSYVAKYARASTARSATRSAPAARSRGDKKTYRWIPRTRRGAARGRAEIREGADRAMVKPGRPTSTSAPGRRRVPRADLRDRASGEDAMLGRRGQRRLDGDRALLETCSPSSAPAATRPRPMPPHASPACWRNRRPRCRPPAADDGPRLQIEDEIGAGQVVPAT